MDAIRLDKVEHQTHQVVVIAVQKAQVGVQSRQHQRLFHTRVQNAVGVVEGSVKRVAGWTKAPSLKREFHRNCPAQRLEVLPTGVALPAADAFGYLAYR